MLTLQPFHKPDVKWVDVVFPGFLVEYLEEFGQFLGMLFGEVVAL